MVSKRLDDALALRDVGVCRKTAEGLQKLSGLDIVLWLTAKGVHGDWVRHDTQAKQVLCDGFRCGGLLW
jgi:hypothetical protein